MRERETYFGEEKWRERRKKERESKRDVSA